jgi:hypothetical protein
VLNLFDAALDGLDSLTQQNVDRVVCALAEKFAEAYGQGAEISAASKFLWIRHKTPVVISDRRARTYLKQLGEEYASYRSEWLKQFDEPEGAIRMACAELVRVQDFSPDGETDESLKSTVEGRWFHERIFDKFLWRNGAR